MMFFYNGTIQKPQPFWFEDMFNVESGKELLRNYWYISIIFSALYVFAIFYIKHYMKSRPSMELRRSLFVWNFILALLSILGTLRMFPGLLHVFHEFGFTFSVCNFDYVTTIQPTNFWGAIFIGSKAFELGDTLFIVLRKKNLNFIHWYHHIMTLMMCWYTTASHVAATHWFGVMNYAVHSLMYTYYMFSSVNVKIPRQIAMVITSMQLTQMIIGSFACYWAIWSKYKGYPCSFPDKAVTVALLVYVSYVILFARLFYFSYIKKERQNSARRKDKQN